MQGVILAGGLGTRLRPATSTVPKAMVPVNGKPFLEYEVELLRSQGVDDLVVCVGYLGGALREHFGTGARFGVKMRYSDDGPSLLGPAGALKRAAPLLGAEFFVTYGDAYLRAPYGPMMRRLRSSEEIAIMAAYKNDNRHGRSDLRLEGGRVVEYTKSGKEGLRWINYGVSALKKAALDLIPPGRQVGEEEFYGALVSRRQLLAYPVTRRFYEIGNPASLAEFSRYASRHALRGRTR